MSILEELTAQREVIPAWLNNIVVENSPSVTSFEAMLQYRVVFYPGSDCRDGLAFELFTHAHTAHCVIHADVGTNLDDVVTAVPRIRGYRPVVLQRLSRVEAREVLQLDEQVFPGPEDPNPMAQLPGLAGAVWSILERKSGLGDQHGPARLAFIHVKCEAAWLFWNLWMRRVSTAPPFAIIYCPEYGGIIERRFGPNGAVYLAAGGFAKRPEWILSRASNKGWPGYEVNARDGGDRTLFRRLPEDHPSVVLSRSPGFFELMGWQDYRIYSGRY
jgi:hypothetical protein